MASRNVYVLTTLALSAGAVIWALVGLPGAPAGCLPVGCDCEAVGPGPIRQPANAWSSLALTATGLFLVIASPGHRRGRREGRRPERRGQPTTSPPPGETRPQGAEGANHKRPGRGGGARAAGPSGGGSHMRPAVGRALLPSPQPPPGSAGRGSRTTGPRAHALTRDLAAVALSIAGLGAFLYHAGVTAWAARLDGITVAVLAAAVGMHAVVRIATAMGHSGRRRISWRQLVPWLLLTLGAVCWWLGRTGGPWCRPDAWLPAHAAWHLLVAAAIGLWLSGPAAAAARQPASPDAA